MNKYFYGVKNTDVGNNFKQGQVRGKIIAVDAAGIKCTLQNKNGTIHVQNRSDVLVSREVKS